MNNETKQAIKILEEIKDSAEERMNVYRYETFFSESDIIYAKQEFYALALAITVLHAQGESEIKNEETIAWCKRIAGYETETPFREGEQCAARRILEILESTK